MLNQSTMAAANERQTLPSEVYETLANAAHLASRVSQLTEQLLGPQPQDAALAGNASAPNGAFDQLRTQMRDTSRMLAQAHAALSAIERELVG